MRIVHAIGTCAAAIAAVSVGGAAPRPAAETFQRIWPGPPPGPADWPSREVLRLEPTPEGGAERVYGDVPDPGVVVVAPPPGRSNGMGVIVLPGGAFMALAWDKEGMVPARWLARLGYTAFVLKYRVRGLPFPSDAELGPQPGAFDKGMAFLAPNVRVAVADGRQAVRFVRDNAKRFGVLPERIGMLGFSAGATTTMDVVVEADERSRPDFAAAIYGAVEDRPAPSGGPPVFVVAAQDDDTVPVEQGIAIFTKWRRAGLPAELHIYGHGGHGFGMGRPGTAPAAWPAAFRHWLRLLPARMTHEPAQADREKPIKVGK